VQKRRGILRTESRIAGQKRHEDTKIQEGGASRGSPPKVRISRGKEQFRPGGRKKRKERNTQKYEEGGGGKEGQ